MEAAPGSRRARWPEDPSFTSWLRWRGWSNLGHVAGAAFLGFVVSVDGGALLGSLWGLSLLLVATPLQYRRCRRANR